MSTKKADNRQYATIAVGSPIVDTMVMTDDAFLKKNVGGEKGGMRLINESQMAALLKKLPNSGISTVGGSAMNTVRAMAHLGAKTAGLGKLGNDQNAEFYRKEMCSANVSDRYFTIAPNLPTARCLALITPDAARTMRTNLGAAANLSAAEITVEDFMQADCVYIEGYVLPNIELAEHLLETAQQAECEVILNLGSFEIVRSLHSKLYDWLTNYVSMVFGNLDEAREFFRDPVGDAKSLAQSLMSICGFAAVTDGANGAIISVAGEETITIPALPPIELVDTTGAGDFWAAGFLYGKSLGLNHIDCGRIAATLAREVIAVTGVDLPPEKWQELRKEINANQEA